MSEANIAKTINIKVIACTLFFLSNKSTTVVAKTVGVTGVVALRQTVVANVTCPLQVSTFFATLGTFPMIRPIVSNVFAIVTVTVG